MAKFIHRDGDKRACGATTEATSTDVRVNGKFVAVDGDPNSHKGGALIANSTVGSVRVNSKAVIVVDDNAKPDAKCPGAFHCNPKAVGHSGDVRAG
jgi:uncharacterized Zn-binding protein involved in type VI secretion